MKFFLGTLLLLTFTAQGFTTHEAPWMENYLRPILTFNGGFQYFNSIAQGSERHHYHGRDPFFSGGIYFEKEVDLSFEFETGITRTHKHPWAFDQLKETIRYGLSDDVLGDDFSSVIGLSLMQPFTIALHDPSFIHHSHFEFEGHYTVGKEWSTESLWETRIWGLGAFGIGERGAPWLRGSLTFEKAVGCDHFIALSLLSQAGLGKKSLCLHRFHSYGSIAYRTLKGKFKYLYLSDDQWSLAFSILQGFYSKNSPYNPTLYTIEFSTPFSL